MSRIDPSIIANIGKEGSRRDIRQGRELAEEEISLRRSSARDAQELARVNLDLKQQEGAQKAADELSKQVYARARAQAGGKPLGAEKLYPLLGPRADAFIRLEQDEQVRELDEGIKQGTLALQERTRYSSFLGEVGNLLTGLSALTEQQRRPALEQAVKRMVQSGIATEEDAADLLDDDLSDTGIQEAIAANPAALKQKIEAENRTFQQQLQKATEERLRMQAETEWVKAQTEANKPPTQPSRPASVQEFEYAKTQGYKGTYEQWQRDEANRKNPTPVTPKGSTGVERRVLSFYIRAKDADETIDSIESDIGKLGTFEQGKLKFFPNIMQSQVGQSYNQAQRAFTEARLRKDSGAAIPPHEYEEDAKTYFVQPGDTKVTLANKKRGRKAIMEALKQESGKAFNEHYGDEGEKGGKDPVGIR